jgi:cyclophilin family peptidyl-prolyl cis-trans isomerase
VPALVAAGVVVVFILGSQLTRTQPPGGSGGLQQYDSAPPMSIDPARSYTATLRTVKGDIVVELLPDKAPVTVNSFVFLARQGYYDGTTFHRVLPDFMAQGGDPTGTGSGGPGYTFEDEFSDLTFDGPGLLAMANGGPNTNGSQFFITYGPTPHLNGKHTIFGRVVEGMDVALALTPRDPRANPTQPGDQIETITIEEQ